MGKRRHWNNKKASGGGVGSEQGDDEHGRLPSGAPKRHKHDGEYPPPHVLESAAFESYYRESGLVPEEEWEAFMATLRQPLGVSFRITGHPDDPGSVALREHMERKHLSQLAGIELDGQPVPPPYPISWFPGRMAWRFDVSRSTLRGKGALKNDDSPAARALSTFHAFLMAEVELGSISRQEEVSMVPPCLLDVRPGHRVADLCAAPGSKTQQLIEAIHPPGHTLGETGGPSGLVIANDMDYRRCHLLVHQAKRLNSPALIVTNHDATMLPTKMASPHHLDKLRFDRILCDVPCSGDGTLRKAPDLWRRWSDGLGMGVHRMQLAVLLRGLQMLVPGGRLVYSTCSMNPIEDEAVVAAALAELGAAADADAPESFHLVDVADQLPGLKRCAGRHAWRVRAGGAWYDRYESVPDKQREQSKLQPSMFAPAAADAARLRLERCMRVLPHQQDTGGFFIAVMERSTAAAATGAAAAVDAGLAPAATGGTPSGLPEGGAAAEAQPVDAAAAADGGHAGGGGVGEDGASGETGGAAAASSSSASAPLVSHIPEQKGVPAGEHVQRALHCNFRKNTGKYDALYELAGWWRSTFGDFFGLPAHFPYEQIVSRSITGKALFLIGSAILQLLQADSSAKLHLVNTGTKVLERVEPREGVRFHFRLAQEGVAWLVPYMSRQRIFIGTADLEQLLRRRSMHVSHFSSPAVREALLGADAGALAIVHDPAGANQLVDGQPTPLVLAASRGVGDSPLIEIGVKQAESASLLNRMSQHVRPAEEAAGSAEGSEEAAASSVD